MLRVTILTLFLTVPAAAQESKLADELRRLDDRTLDTPRPALLRDDVRSRIAAANRRESAAWNRIRTKADWEAYRDPRIAALRRSLGEPVPVDEKMPVRVTRELAGKDHVVENLVFESRPGLWVTANLYRPNKSNKADKTHKSPPGILIVHSHHNPKTEGELQDMGVNWARLGCAVLVMDQLGHGERRQHPYIDDKSYPGMFRRGRQDYHFRYNVALQLHVAGESLIGWMAHDLQRGVDVLLKHARVDPKRVALLGAVAGGGDPAGVTAALDPRIAVVAPFNFGGPQPETIYPLPNDADAAFNYAGGGSWESTRNLRLSARDGFQPWVIVGSVAPRGLIHAHEFAWDRERDPVWRRYQKIFSLYEGPDLLAAATGRGKLSGRPPESTHCNNIGPEHRKGLYPSLKKWLDIPTPEKEVRERRPASELACLTPAIKTKPVWQLARELGDQRVAAARKKLDGLDPKARRQQLRKDWARLLGNIEPATEIAATTSTERLAGFHLVRLALTAEEGVPVPALLLLPRVRQVKLPLVVGVCQEGKSALLKQRAEVVEGLLRGGAAVCLLDVRGTGETKPDGGRGRTSSATSLSASELMLGQTLLGSRLRDLRTALAYLRERPEIDARRLVVWGDSLATDNKPDVRLDVPLDVAQPPHSEPLGGLLALFAPLYEEGLKGAYGWGGLVNYRSLLGGPFVHVPHDAVVPGAMTVGDLDLVREAVGDRVLSLGEVDGLNRLAGPVAPRDPPAAWMLRVLKQ